MKQQNLSTWLKKAFIPSQNRKSFSGLYSLKHAFEYCRYGKYISAAEFIQAVIDAGYRLGDIRKNESGIILNAQVFITRQSENGAIYHRTHSKMLNETQARFYHDRGYSGYFDYDLETDTCIQTTRAAVNAAIRSNPDLKIVEVM